MGFDIRLPIGALLGAIGALLVIHGLAADAAVFARSLGFNVNLWWGLVMFVVGAGFLAAARAKR